jgi:hypothetical protein
MKQSRLSEWMGIILIGIFLCGLAVLFGAFPYGGKILAEQYPEFSFCYIPWLVLLWTSGVPCSIVLFFCWNVLRDIRKGSPFSVLNGRRLKRCSVLMAVDAGFFFLMNWIYLFVGMNHPSILLLSMAVSFAGLGVSVLFLLLSSLVMRAAQLQEQSDLTI